MGNLVDFGLGVRAIDLGVFFFEWRVDVIIEFILEGAYKTVLQMFVLFGCCNYAFRALADV